MKAKRKILCVSTTKPSTALTTGGGGGSLTLICPHTGSIQSSLRVAGDTSGKDALGVSSLSTFPSSFSKTNSTLALGFGFNNKKKDDSYGLLFTLRSGASPPILHWKCRLPEAQMSAGILVSRCGNFIIGGSASGSLYIWKSLGGVLFRTVKAHYRSISVMTWSSCGRFLVTGGADGMVNVFSLMCLVETCNSATDRPVLPIQTWTKHHLAVTALVPLSSGRIVSSSDDGQVLLMELFSGSVLSTIHLPHPVTALSVSNSRLFVGCKSGIIHIVDLDEYALHHTAQLGANIQGRHRTESGMSHQERVFGTIPGSATGNDETPYLMELNGHNRAVTALAVVEASLSQGGCLVSGDELGSLRVWDLDARNCVRLIHPWSYSTEQKINSTTRVTHPVTSINVLEERLSVDSPGGGSVFSGATGNDWNHEKNMSSISTMITPLQKFRQDGISPLPVPFLHSKSSKSVRSMWSVREEPQRSFVVRTALRRKRLQQDNRSCPVTTNGKNNGRSEDELQRLREELEEAKDAIKRWETVNNKLILRLQQQS